MNNQQPTSNLLKRETYKAIKRMEREQLSAYVSNIYIKGFQAGQKAAAPNALLNAFRDTLLSVADIGPTRADAIIKRLSDTLKLDAAAEQPKPAPASDAVKRLATELYDCGMDCCKICVHDRPCLLVSTKAMGAKSGLVATFSFSLPPSLPLSPQAAAAVTIRQRARIRASIFFIFIINALLSVLISLYIITA